jgi:hypothetical protein
MQSEPELSGITGHDDTGLTPTQELAAEAIAAGEYEYIAARRAGVNDRTIRRWLSNPAFTRHVKYLRSRSTDRVVGRLAAMSGEAMETMYRIMREAPRISDRLRAAEDILDMLFKAEALEEQAERIGELEARLEALTQGTTGLKVRRCS